MDRSISRSSFEPQFEKFLYAAIDYDDEGMPLSVLSALARMDLDPWAQAASLAHLPRDAAIYELRSLIAALPEDKAGPRDLDQLSEHLLALLPRKDFLPLTARSFVHAVGSPSLFSSLRLGVLIGLMLSTQWFMASCQQSTQINNPPSAPASAASTRPLATTAEAADPRSGPDVADPLKSL
jgi:hypothetical protein